MPYLSMLGPLCQEFSAALTHCDGIPQSVAFWKTSVDRTEYGEVGLESVRVERSFSDRAPGLE
jgi:hypothetical protein